MSFRLVVIECVIEDLRDVKAAVEQRTEEYEHCGTGGKLHAYCPPVWRKLRGRGRETRKPSQHVTRHAEEVLRRQRWNEDRGQAVHAIGPSEPPPDRGHESERHHSHHRVSQVSSDVERV